MTNPFKVTDSRTADVFRKPQLLRMLSLLGQGEWTAKALAAACGMKLNLTCYHLKRFSEMGLIEQTGNKARAGRPSRLYRATATSFFVPSELAKHALGEELNRELRLALARSDRDFAGELFFAEAEAGGRMRARKIRSASDSSIPVGKELWARLKLNNKDACKMMEELKQVMDRYADRGGEGGQLYLIHAAAAPVEGGT